MVDGGGWLSGFVGSGAAGFGLEAGGGGAGPLFIDGFLASTFGGGPLPKLPSFFSSSVIITIKKLNE